MKSRTLSALCATTLLAVSMLTFQPAPQADAQALASLHGGGAIKPAQIGAGEQFRIRLTRLHCSNANEDGWLSDGDEPYVIVAVIRPGAAIPGAGVLPALDFFITRTYGDVDAHDNRYPNLDVLARHVESSVAVVAMVIEHDSSEKDLVYGTARAFAEADFGAAILGGETDPWTLSGVVADAMQRGVDATDLPLVDDDERIGAPAAFLATAATFDDLVVGGPASSVTREVRGNGARYSMDFEITRTR